MTLHVFVTMMIVSILILRTMSLLDYGVTVCVMHVYAENVRGSKRSAVYYIIVLSVL
jgi:hypothetical protein